MTLYRFQVVIEQDEDGLYVAEVPALPACYSQGRTFEEAYNNVREVVGMCLEEMRQDGRAVDPRYPEVVGIKTLEIAFDPVS